MGFLDGKSKSIFGSISGFGKKAGTSLFDKIKNFWHVNMRRF